MSTISWLSAPSRYLLCEHTTTWIAVRRSTGSVPGSSHQQVICLFIYKLRTQCHTIIAETVQNNNRHWRRPTQVLKHLRVALKHKHTRKLYYSKDDRAMRAI